VSALGERFAILPWFAVRALEWSGVALAAAGYALRIAAMTRLGSRFSPLVSVQRQHALETAGVYARIRHPGYAGSWLACAGSALAFGSALAAPLLLLFLAVLFGRIRREEALLAERFGEEFARYRARTGALWPRAGRPADERLGGSRTVL
jgi:protein-S-isoprenylcysteine O-methyltransferase Ste14